MPNQINEPGAAIALIREFSLKGRVHLDLDDRIVPVVQIADVSPQADQGTKCGGMISVGALAANLGVAGVSAAPGTKLVVDRVILANTSGGVVTYSFVLLSSGNLGTIGVTLFQLTSYQSAAPAGGFPVIVAGTIFTGTHTTAAIGTLMMRVRIPGAQSMVIDLGAELFGTNLLDVAGLGVFGSTLNSVVDVSWICREIPLG